MHGTKAYADAVEVTLDCARKAATMIEAHPDHGGADDDAAQRIADITEARRILLAS